MYLARYLLLVVFFFSFSLKHKGQMRTPGKEGFLSLLLTTLLFPLLLCLFGTSRNVITTDMQHELNMNWNTWNLFGRWEAGTYQQVGFFCLASLDWEFGEGTRSRSCQPSFGKTLAGRSAYFVGTIVKGGFVYRWVHHTVASHSIVRKKMHWKAFVFSVKWKTTRLMWSLRIQLRMRRDHIKRVLVHISNTFLDSKETDS